MVYYELSGIDMLDLLMALNSVRTEAKGEATSPGGAELLVALNSARTQAKREAVFQNIGSNDMALRMEPQCVGSTAN